MSTWNLTPLRVVRLVACFEALAPVFTSAGLPRLAAWARLQRERVLLLSDTPSDELAHLEPQVWAARVLAPTQTFLPSLPPLQPWLWVLEAERNLWLLPAGPLRAAVLQALYAAELPLVAPPPDAEIQALEATGLSDAVVDTLVPRYAALIRATEALEQALFDAGQRAPLASCVAFRLVLHTLLPPLPRGNFSGRAWLSLAGPPIRPWAWAFSGDAAGLADQVRATLGPVEERDRVAIHAALDALLSAAGLPPGATGEARHQARVAALRTLIRLSSASPARHVALLQAALAVLEGDEASARSILDATPARGGDRDREERGGVLDGDLLWLIPRLRRWIGGPEARAAFRALGPQT